MRPMMSSRSGCSNGSPPLMVITDVRNSPSLSIRRNMISVGTGLEKSSYSLQYLQARLQRRMGMICASSGWSVERNAPAILPAPRNARDAALSRLCNLDPEEGILYYFRLNHAAQL